MLWQGQEFVENYVLPDNGNGRIRLRRDALLGEYIYDQKWRAACALVPHLRQTPARTASPPQPGVFLLQRSIQATGLGSGLQKTVHGCAPDSDGVPQFLGWSAIYRSPVS